MSATQLFPDRAIPIPEPKGRPLVMGILNLTPDSFYAGSRALEDAVARGLTLLEEGADILDLGGESTRPGAEPVDADEESRRVLPALEALAKRSRVPLSIDTSKAVVAERALSAGAAMLNDVTALRGDARMPSVAARYPAVVLMHMLGTGPRDMQRDPRYRDVIAEILSFLEERIGAFAAAGGSPERVWVDPGIGFGKTLEHNLEIFRGLEAFQRLGRPLLVGASRKSFIGRILGGQGAPLEPESRLEGSLAAACRAAQAGAAAVRVHDVGQTRRLLEVWGRIAEKRY